MNWILSNGNKISINVSRFIINWDSPAASKEAQKLQDFLYIHCRSHLILAEFLIPHSKKLRVDYLDLTTKVAFEHNGAQHNKMIKFYHKNQIGFLNSVKRDENKRIHLERNGFKLVETQKEDFPLTRQFFADNYDLYL